MVKAAGGTINEERFATMNEHQWLWHYEHLQRDQRLEWEHKRSLVFLLGMIVDPERTRIVRDLLQQAESEDDFAADLDLIEHGQARAAALQMRDRAPDDMIRRIAEIKGLPTTPDDIDTVD